jgi:hypothetical protein
MIHETHDDLFLLLWRDCLKQRSEDRIIACLVKSMQNTTQMSETTVLQLWYTIYSIECHILYLQRA